MYFSIKQGNATEANVAAKRELLPAEKTVLPRIRPNIVNTLRQCGEYPGENCLAKTIDLSQWIHDEHKESVEQTPPRYRQRELLGLKPIVGVLAAVNPSLINR